MRLVDVTIIRPDGTFRLVSVRPQDVKLQAQEGETVRPTTGADRKSYATRVKNLRKAIRANKLSSSGDS